MNHFARVHIDFITVPSGKIPRVSTQLTLRDRWGAVKVRWNIGRNRFRIEPGLYAVGDPDASSDVFVTANYKLSFDHLRKNLGNLNAWILVLDTKGINVWCAAGKGTFGTDELVRQIINTRLRQIVSHRKLIVPQLGATGVSAHKLKAMTSGEQDKKAALANVPEGGFAIPNFTKGVQLEKGFRVIYGPVRTADIKEFIANGYKTNDQMKRVTFPFWERLKLVPVDLVYGATKLLAIMALFFLLSLFNSSGFSFTQGIEKGFPALLFLAVGYLSGILVTPALLPYIPVRMFGFKGLLVGLVASLILYFSRILDPGILHTLAWFMLIPAIASFMAMNFTGSSTFTSLTGVKREMKIFVPVQISLAGIGLILFIISNFVDI